MRKGELPLWSGQTQCESKGRDSDIFIPGHSLTSALNVLREERVRAKLDRGQFRERDTWADTE